MCEKGERVLLISDGFTVKDESSVLKHWSQSSKLSLSQRAISINILEMLNYFYRNAYYNI